MKKPSPNTFGDGGKEFLLAFFRAKHRISVNDAESITITMLFHDAGCSFIGFAQMLA
ncbi:MAG: hypothetical protein Pars93KO_22340 [Parasphingorhabdus sp.]